MSQAAFLLQGQSLQRFYDPSIMVQNIYYPPLQKKIDCYAFQKQEGRGKNLRTRHRCIYHIHSYVLGPQSARLLIAAREAGFS